LQRKLIDGTYIILQEQVFNMACYKSALIDLDRRWANKGQAMQTYITLDELSKAVKLYFTAEDPIKAHNYIYDCISQPDRLRRVDTGDSEAIVGSANIDEIAEVNRND
jgi:hypothetical protein